MAIDSVGPVTLLHIREGSHNHRTRGMLDVTGTEVSDKLGSAPTLLLLVQ